MPQPPAYQCLAVMPSMMPLMPYTALPGYQQLPEKPMKGLSPHNMHKPTSDKELRTLVRASKATMDRKREIMSKAFHCDILYLEDPQGVHWCGIECWAQAAANWNLKFQHVVGPVNSIRMPSCAYCGKNTHNIEPLARCRVCSLIAYCHETEILEGNVYRSDPSYLK